MVRKIIFGLFICFALIFTMSHNVNALNFSMDLDSYEQVYYSGAISSEFSYDINGSNLTTVNNCVVCSVSNPGIINVRSLKPLVPVLNFKKNDIITFDLLIWTKLNYSVDNIIKIINIFPDNSNFNYLGYENVTYEFSPDIMSSYTLNGNDEINGFRIYSKNQGYVVARLYFRVKNDTNAPIKLSSSNFIFEYMSIEGEINFRLANYFLYRPVESKENKEVEEKTQGAVDQSATDGNSSQNSVEGSTQSLMSAGASIMSALTSAPATDCNISVNTTGSSSVFTTAIGQLNLCSNVPSGILNMVQGIVALVFTPIVLYFTYNVITTLYNQFKEYNS